MFSFILNLNGKNYDRIRSYMDEAELDKVKKKRNDLAYQIETLIQDFTNKTNYIVEKMAVEYKNSDSGVIPKVSNVRISIRLGLDGMTDSPE